MLASSVVALAIAPTASASNVNADRSKIARLEGQISAEGATAQLLVARLDTEIAKEIRIKQLLTTTQHALKADEAAKTKSAHKLQLIAVDTYVYEGSSGGASTLISVPSALSSVASVYANLSAGELQTAETTYRVNVHRVVLDEAALKREESSVAAVVRSLIPDRFAANAAIVRDDALLAGVRGNLKILLAADRRRQQAEAAAEKQLSKQSIVESASSVKLPAPVPTSVSSGRSGYVDPLRAVSALSPSRVDQGVDYDGFGPVYALGDGVVLSTVNGGWPGGTFITYRLTDGPAAGLVVYVAEDIVPRVFPGESVTPDTVLGDMYEGPTGIETGWADGSLGDTMAMVTGEFGGSNSTAFGANFSGLLISLGAPGGILQNSPPTGGLLAGWPSW
ncbi:MAG TPA: hypothetical protein VKR27_01765 [Acidimicrobiales bacterium]|nr:hypothetical protein [Acidimicrobiales bacterium]